MKKDTFMVGVDYRKILENELKGGLKRIIYFKNEIITREAFKDDYIYFLDTGKVILIKKDIEEREYSVGYVLPGELFALSSYLGMEEIATYKALTSCVVLAVDALYLKKRLQFSSELRDLISFLVIKSFRNLNIRQANLMLKDSKQIFINFLIEHINIFGREEDGKITIDLDINIGEISKLLNMSRETVSRMLSDLKGKGIIEGNRKQIIIKEYGRLLEIKTS
ncbi:MULTISPECIES: Crp/Fnr family transcriptional regulator [Caloramator]|uniref:Transcriptional regulator, Crp/Fnr family n=1 Tax=Caloramator australicus RC3 TaxID=857293 RepID=I7J4N0_9CLOT|nr:MULTISPECIES: Crp/Fnr family transcriptional regulator [Caloramator]MDO6355848.1 Crp/Fnr family transcriptional regulator [Caloramator sp. CAR-1]CCJ32766.1 transcriptional regulator, Crp/Fnr family [Caloramator australicus RC3]